MRGIGFLAGAALALAVLAAAGSRPATAQTPTPLAAPTNVRIENAYNPLPTDLILIPRVLRWDAAAGGAASYRVEQRTLPPRDPSGFYEPTNTLVATVGPTDPREYRFETADWRGPYCFRVVAAYPSGEFHASEPACIAKQTDDSPFDIHQLTIGVEATGSGFFVTWESPFYRGEFSVQKAIKRGAEDPREEDWGYASMHFNGVDGQYEFGDLGTIVGQVYCYRVRPDIEDGRWSPPACLTQPPVDGPQPGLTPLSPGAGNGVSAPLRHVPFPWEFTVGGVVLLIVAFVNWWVFRGYR